MTIRLRRRDVIRLHLGAPIYPRVDWAPAIVLRHHPWDLRDPRPTERDTTWWWKHTTWRTWRALPTDPLRDYTLEEIEPILRQALQRYPGVNLAHRRRRKRGKPK